MDTDKLEELTRVDTDTIVQVLASMVSRYQSQLEIMQKDLTLANLYVVYVQKCIAWSNIPMDFMTWCKDTVLQMLSEEYIEEYANLLD